MSCPGFHTVLCLFVASYERPKGLLTTYCCKNIYPHKMYRINAICSYRATKIIF